MNDDPNRLTTLQSQDRLNGIDFVELVDTSQKKLRVHFMNAKPNATALKDALKSVKIRDLATGAKLNATAETWAEGPLGRPTLIVNVAAPGGFSTHELRITTEDPITKAPILDRYFDHIEFSFKALCESTVDCRPRAPACPPTNDDAPPIDYLAKDFHSFRRALLEFSALRYPAWEERSEADFGVMFMEALSGLADDLSYHQDRIAREAWLETATERRSLVRLARLVDYEPTVATCSQAWLVFEVRSDVTEIPAGLRVSALTPDGELVPFETGTGIVDETRYAVRARWHRMKAYYWWDDEERCLERGSTSIWVEYDHAEPPKKGQPILIETAPELEGNRPLRQVVHLDADPEVVVDSLFGTSLLRLTWSTDEALERDRVLTRTSVSANVVPATQGQHARERFTTTKDWPAPSDLARAAVRLGANGGTQFLYTLDHGPLAWLRAEDKALPHPELTLTETATGAQWRWLASLLDARTTRNAFTLDPVKYRPVTVRGAETSDRDLGTVEYDGAEGDTIRFGDDHFGGLPGDGSVFEVHYRTGGGARGNVAADSISRIDSSHPSAAGVLSVTNPLPAAGGRDAESAASVRESAPQRFRREPLRAVTTRDYEDAAQSLRWVQRAGTEFRYTGSWLTVFTSADPVGQVEMSVAQETELTEQLNRRRMAGYESYVLGPRYAAIDLLITVCARPDVYAGDVRAAVLSALDASAHVDGTVGFFHPDRFSFGDPLERSAIEAAVQASHGVAGVVDIEYRWRGHTVGYETLPDALPVGMDEIVRVDNDPRHPGGGSLRVNVEGGK